MIPLNRLRFGMPTLVELDTIDDCCALCRELGLDFVEINMNLPQYQADTLDFHVMQAQTNVGFTFHLDERLDPADFNPLVAEAYLHTTLATIENAKALHAPVLNMHMAYGVHFTLPDHKVALYDRYRDHYLARLRKFRDKCEAAIGDSGILICVENCEGFPDYQREAIDLLLERPVFALTLDIGHCHFADGVDDSFILERQNRLSHMHIHDAGHGTCHLVLGKGDIDLDARLTLARGTGCRCVIEAKSAAGLRESVHWLRERGYH